MQTVIALMFVIWTFMSGASTVAAETPAGVAVALERAVHFMQADGSSLVVEAGSYRAELQESVIRLTPEKGGAAVEIAVQPLSLDMSVQEPMVVSLTRNSDEHLLVFADPNGGVVGATGTYSGIGSRDLVKINTPIVTPIVTAPQLPGGNILPGVPRVKSLAVASFANQGALVPFANANVTIVLHNLLGQAGTTVPYRLVPPGSITGQSTCTLTRNPRIVVQEFFRLDQNGEGRISLPGWFTSAGTCAIGLELSLPGKPDPARLVAGPIQVQTPVRYTVTGTSRLKNVFGVRASSSLGICEGTSIGPTNFPVGVIEHGSDLAYRIRSGPIGTDCQYISKPWVLPDGVRLVSTKWESVREIPSGQQQGKCCVVSAFGNNCITITRPPVESFNFSRGAAPIVTGERAESPPYYSVTSSDAQILEDGVILLENTPPRVVTVVKPMWGKLQCTNTLVNDHGVKLILRELLLEGPPGLSF